MMGNDRTMFDQLAAFISKKDGMLSDSQWAIIKAKWEAGKLNDTDYDKLKEMAHSAVHGVKQPEDEVSDMEMADDDSIENDDDPFTMLDKAIEAIKAKYK